MSSFHHQSEYGGADLERVFLHDVTVSLPSGAAKVAKSYFPKAASMSDVFMRHVGRYGLILPFVRPGYRVLDFPCGSGLGLEIMGELARFGQFFYDGRDADPVAVAYCQKVYGARWPWCSFQQDDLQSCSFAPASFDTICCIEGIEHIDHPFQIRIIAEFFRSLKPNGTLVLSCPLPVTGISGPNPKNPYHLWEMTLSDLKTLLTGIFGVERVECLTQMNTLSTGETSVMAYAVCHKAEI